MTSSTQTPTYSEREIAQRWYPLVISRFLMCLETPVAAFALAVLPHPEIGLSAFGALLTAICYLFQSPTWNLLGSSAALVRTKEDLKILIQFLYRLCAAMISIYLLLVVGPLSKYLVIPLFGASHELWELTLPSFWIGALWPFFMGYRRINQGVLIHVGESKLVSLISITRLISLILSLIAAYLIKPNITGLTIVAMCITIGVFVETGFSHYFVKKYALSKLSDRKSELTVKKAWQFCGPLILASVIGQIMMPIGSAVLFRMPEARLSLVVWPSISGLLMLIRTPGFSVLELTASCGDNPANRAAILKFSNFTALFFLLFLAVFILSGVGETYFSVFGGLGIEYAKFANATLVFALLFPAIEIRLWYLMGCAYALNVPKIILQAACVAVAVGLVLYFVGLNQLALSGAAFFLVILTVCTTAESLVFSHRLKGLKINSVA